MIDTAKTAAIIAEEMVADLKEWIDAAERWGERYEQYGKQFKDALPPSIRESIEKDIREQLDRFDSLGDR